MLTAEAAGPGVIPYEVERLVERGLIASAEAQLRSADARCRAAHAAVLDARRALEQARSQPKDLLAAAAAGSAVSDAEIDRVFASEALHRTRLTFREETAAAADLSAKRARNNLEEARRSAFLPVLRAAVGVRIQAAAQSEAAQGTLDRHPNRAALASAQEAWDKAAELLEFIRLGCSLLSTVAIDRHPPPTAELERRTWESRFPGITRAAA